MTVRFKGHRQSGSAEAESIHYCKHVCETSLGEGKVVSPDLSFVKMIDSV